MMNILLPAVTNQLGYTEIIVLHHVLPSTHISSIYSFYLIHSSTKPRKTLPSLVTQKLVKEMLKAYIPQNKL